jgi:hypothetical protein
VRGLSPGLQVVPYLDKVVDKLGPVVGCNVPISRGLMAGAAIYRKYPGEIHKIRRSLCNYKTFSQVCCS